MWWDIDPAGLMQFYPYIPPSMNDWVRIFTRVATPSNTLGEIWQGSYTGSG